MTKQVAIGKYNFQHVCEITPRTRPGGDNVVFPEASFRNDQALPLNKYGSGPFCKFKIPTTYKASGVYVVQVDRDFNYLGGCENLAARWNMGYGNISPRNCFKGGQETNCRLNNLIYVAILDGHHVSLWFHQTANYKSAELELRTIKRWLWNRR
jgi:hypothetical protein